MNKLNSQNNPASIARAIALRVSFYKDFYSFLFHRDIAPISAIVFILISGCLFGPVTGLLCRRYRVPHMY